MSKSARHYAARLRELNTMYRQGGASAEAAPLELDNELPTILHLREEVERLFHRYHDAVAGAACASFARGGAALINLRLHPRERIRWIESGIEAASLAEDAPRRARMWNDLGVCHAAVGEFERAADCYGQALVLTRDTEEGPLVAALGNLANLHLRRGKPDEAIELLAQVMQAARARNDSRAVADALNSTGAAYKDKQDYARSIDYHRQALALHRKIKDLRGEGSALVNLGVSCRKSGDPLVAIDCYETALPLLRSVRDERAEGDALWNLALALHEVGNTGRAIQCARDALAIRERLEDPCAAKIRERLKGWSAGAALYSEVPSGASPLD